MAYVQDGSIFCCPKLIKDDHSNVFCFSPVLTSSLLPLQAVTEGG